MEPGVEDDADAVADGRPPRSASASMLVSQGSAIARRAPLTSAPPTQTMIPVA